MVSVCNKLDYSESWTIEPNFQTRNTKVCYSRICLVALTFCFKKFHLVYVVKLPPTVYGHEKTYEKKRFFSELSELPNICLSPVPPLIHSMFEYSNFIYDIPP